MSDTRARLLTATNELFRRQGFNGTSMSEVTDAAAAPTGSLYHYFPGGKDALAEAVLAESGEAYRQLFVMIASEAADPVAAIDDFFDGAAAVLEETGFIDPCPIGTVAREVASTNEELRMVADRVFVSWIETAAELFVDAGLPAEEAVELATTVVAALEGGFVLARTRRDGDLLRAIGRRIRTLVADVLATLPSR